MDLTGLAAVVLIFGGGTLFLLAMSPVGRALADRIRGRAAGLGEDARGELEGLRTELLGEVQQLRTEVSELGERMDFAERLLAQRKEGGRLAPPG